MEIKAYIEKFQKFEKNLINGQRAQQIIAWDWRAITPKAAASARADVLGQVSDQNFKLMTAPELLEVCRVLCDDKNCAEVPPVVRMSAKTLLRQGERMAKIPSELFSEFTVAQARSEAAWEQAKRTDDWELYRPHLQNMFDYTNKFIDLWGYTGSRYNALIGYEEEGMTVDILNKLFADVREVVVPLVKQISQSGVKIDDTFLNQSFCVENQRIMADKLLKLMGFDKKCGVLAESEHPYTTSFGAQDVRLTTHYYPDKFLPAVFSTLHEGGHGLYEQKIGHELWDTSVGCGLHSGMHESVSRFWENMVGRSAEFWQKNLCILKELYPKELEGVTPERMYMAVNKSGRSYTRMEADELTYNLHIMLRYELERDVFEGKAQVSDLPRLWKEKMESYLGLTPPTDTLGILQDIQWSMGQFGYFPAYALGNMYNAQYSAVMKKDMDFYGIIARGEYDKILDYKTEKLYKYGSMRTPTETLVALTGEGVNAKYLTDYLSQKFKKIYNIK